MLIATTSAVMVSACASTGYTPRPFPIPGGVVSSNPSNPSNPANPSTRPTPANRGPFDGYAVTGTALALRGAPYLNGGTDPSAGFDCSGFTQYVFSQHGMALPREVRDQFRLGKPVKADEIVAGDLLFFTTTDPGASHVGIALDNDQFIHAPSSNGVVRVERLTSSYWRPRFLGARRVN